MKEIKINGEIYTVSKHLTILEFLKENKFSCEKIAIEKDGSILPKNLWEYTTLSSGQSYEIVEFVCGG